MKSRIYHGIVSHTRQTPIQHHFKYPVFFMALDIDELPGLDRNVSGFGHNRFAPLSIRDTDYLTGTGTLRQRVEQYLPDHILEKVPGRIVLVTAPRYFGYVFNPVSFWYIYDSTEQLLCAVAEVNNTFGERHIYVLSEPGASSSREHHASADKVFHVSPFFDRTGRYRFHLTDPGRTVRIRINLEKDHEVAILTQLSGKGRPFSSVELMKTVFRYPFSTILTVPRITWQAARLWLQRKLPVHSKPAPDHEMTVQVTPPTYTQKLSFRLFKRIVNRMQSGSLLVELPDGTQLTFGEGTTGYEDAPRMKVREWSFFTRLARATDIALGDMYVDGTWTTEDLMPVLATFARNIHAINGETRRKGIVSNWLNRFQHVMHRNTRTGSQGNIEAHYDLSNVFFKSWLDKTMTYSCALFQSSEDTLEEAQANKFNRIIQKAGIQAHHHILEIGSGWGGFAIHAARKTGCRVTTITLSLEQLTLARERIRAAELEDRITVELRDYRDITGTFDQIISIEMLEAVGHAFLGSYFEQVDRLLKPDGRALIQVITIPDHRYDAYRRKPDWIQKRIFPGGMLPSLEVMSREIARKTNLDLLHIENFGPHYARTLLKWRERFQAVSHDLTALGFDGRFQRMWTYYLCYCEAGFREAAIHLLQLTLCKPGDPGPDPVFA